uniref:(northern house mosquito) hypothetical protein n=1 Tax=Culex pipiens TaxID=7175 RepID=A0A8D8MT51_CULPI
MVSFLPSFLHGDAGLMPKSASSSQPPSLSSFSELVSESGSGVNDCICGRSSYSNAIAGQVICRWKRTVVYASASPFLIALSKPILARTRGVTLDTNPEHWLGNEARALFSRPKVQNITFQHHHRKKKIPQNLVSSPNTLAKARGSRAKLF